MLRLQSFLLIAFLISVVLAAPQKRSFKIERVKQHNYKPSGKYALRKAYRKFGISDLKFRPKTSKSGGVSAAANTTTTSDEGNVTATGSQNDAEYLSPVSVGGQTLVMDFDTGSSDMWVFNTNLAAADQTGHTIYDPTKSTTAAAVEGATFNISYGDGSFASGPVGTDQVTIGGAVVDNQTIGLPDTVSAEFASDTSSNGLVGLAMSTLNTVRPGPAQTFFANVAPTLAQQVFTANLKKNTTGAYTFGEIDSTAYTGTMNQVAVDTTNGFWQFQSTSFAVGNGTAQANTQSGTAIADTGTSLLVVDPQVVEAYYDQVTGAVDSEEEGGVVFPCSSTLPDLQVATGDSMATIPADLMIFEQTTATNEAGETMCYGAVQSNDDSGLQIYGDTFFQSQFVAFQNTNPPTLGIAPHA